MLDRVIYFSSKGLCKHCETVVCLAFTAMTPNSRGGEKEASWIRSRTKEKDDVQVISPIDLKGQG